MTFLESNFDADNTAQDCKLRKQMAKSYESFCPIEFPTNSRVDLWVEERKKFEGKIKLYNKLIDTSLNSSSRGYLKRL